MRLEEDATAGLLFGTKLQDEPPLASVRLDREIVPSQLQNAIRLLDRMHLRTAGEPGEHSFGCLIKAIPSDAEDGRGRLLEPGHRLEVDEVGVFLIRLQTIDATLRTNRLAVPLRLVDQPVEAVEVALLAHLLVVNERLGGRPRQVAVPGGVIRKACGKFASVGHG